MLTGTALLVYQYILCNLRDILWCQNCWETLGKYPCSNTRKYFFVGYKTSRSVLLYSSMCLNVSAYSGALLAGCVNRDSRCERFQQGASNTHCTTCTVYSSMQSLDYYLEVITATGNVIQSFLIAFYVTHDNDVNLSSSL